MILYMICNNIIMIILILMCVYYDLCYRLIHNMYVSFCIM